MLNILTPLGPTVRTGPNQIAFSDVQDVRTIHKMGSGFLKTKWYERLMLRGTLVCIVPVKEHAARRKHFSKAFSQQNLNEWESAIKTKIAFRIAAMRNEGGGGKDVDILAQFKAIATEVVIELCYGESTDAEQASTRNALAQSIRNELLLLQSERAQNMAFYLRYLPRLLPRLIVKKFIPRSITQPKLQLWKSDEEHKQTILSKALADNEAGLEGALPWLIIVKEAIAFLVAGTDTTAVTATYLIWAILRHPKVHARLAEELSQLPPEFTITQVQSLLYLHCVIRETLRLYGAVSTGLPRRTPKGGCQVGDVFVPEGTTVTTQAFTLHRDSEVFENPLNFEPDRWENTTLDMKEAFMPFGIGARGQSSFYLRLMLADENGSLHWVHTCSDGTCSRGGSLCEGVSKCEDFRSHGREQHGA